jgi:hypothetical protein
MNAGGVGARGVWVFVGKLVQRPFSSPKPLAILSLCVALRLPICAFLCTHARLVFVAYLSFCSPPPTKPFAIICCILVLFSLAFSCFLSLPLSLCLAPLALTQALRLPCGKNPNPLPPTPLYHQSVIARSPRLLSSRPVRVRPCLVLSCLVLSCVVLSRLFQPLFASPSSAMTLFMLYCISKRTP